MITSRLGGVPTRHMINIVAIPRAQIKNSTDSDAISAGGTGEIEKWLTATLPLVILGAMNVNESQTKPIVAIKVDI